MSHDECVHAKMKEAFETRPWMGVISKEEALFQLLGYRDGLRPQEKALYDEQILSGRHPSNAAETVGLMREAGLIPSDESLVLDKAS